MVLLFFIKKLKASLGQEKEEATVD